MNSLKSAKNTHMPTITQRQTAKGKTRYRVEIVKKSDGKIIHRESKTFGTNRLAVEWGKRREAELALPNALEMVKYKNITLGDVLKTYYDATSSNFGRSKNATIKFLMNQDIATRPIVSIRALDIIRHCQYRVALGTSGVTVANDVFYIKAVFKYARSALGMPLNISEIEDASEVLRDNRIIKRAAVRDRRPSFDELQKLDAYFSQHQTTSYPMRFIMWFAIYSCRRQDEICRIRRADIDWEHKTYLVRDLKNPEGSAGNNKHALMTDKCCDLLKQIIDHVQDVDGRVFACDAKTVSAYFTRACKMLGIQDLRFHDLRHEGASRLAELGYTIPQIQQVTLHESWGSLAVYINMRHKKEALFEYQ